LDRSGPSRGLRGSMPAMQPAEQPGAPAAAAAATGAEAEATTPPVPALPPLGAAASEPARPPSRVLRFLKAYWVTFVVVASYLSLRVTARLRDPASTARLLHARHLRNARRI